MSECSGEDLLKVFKDLNISLLNLSPNVIKAWFDTDDKDLKQLLTWMCTSLSKENYLSPLEYAEFLEIRSPLTGEEYEKELKNFEAEYPGIFDVQMNELEIELLEDEIELALEEEKRLNELMKINETLKNQLSKDLESAKSDDIKTDVKLKSTQERCHELGEKLDEVNEKLHMQLVKYGSNLYNFEYGCVPNFINNMDVKEWQHNFENVKSFLTPLLDKELFSIDSSTSVTISGNKTCSDSRSSAQSMNMLTTMKNRLLHSHQNYLITKIEVEKAKETYNYLNKTDINALLSLEESAFAQISREGKEETKRRMCAMLDNISEKVAEGHIAQIKYKYAQQELEQYQVKLESLKKIEDTVVKFLSQYVLLNILYIQEKKDIDSSDHFFRKILQYINQDLQSCTLRTEKMNKIIRESEDYNSKHFGEKSNTIKSIVKTLTNGEDFDAGKALEVVGEFKTELDRWQTKLFGDDFYSHREMAKELRSSVDVLQSFLTCGPTHRVVVMPPELQQILGQVEDHLKKQRASLKSTVQVSLSMKKVPNKWQNYRRQLWMYFYADQQKLGHVLEEIADEFKKLKSNGVKTS